MPDSSITSPDLTATNNELSYYLQVDAPEIDLPAPLVLDILHTSQQCFYILPLGKLQLLELTIYLSAAATSEDIEAARVSALKSALAWQKRGLQSHKESGFDTAEVLVLDIQLIDETLAIVCGSEEKGDAEKAYDQKSAALQMTSMPHSFGAGYFMEELVLDINDDTQVLQVFSWQDWQMLVATAQTPSDIWRFLRYHLTEIRQSSITGMSRFDTEDELIKRFMGSADLLSQAITVDNALIKYGIQDEPNSALVTMSLAQERKNATTQMYHEHRLQAAKLWSQLIIQMVDLAATKPMQEEVSKTARLRSQWQQQLLDESLFSRHELVRTLYMYPKQSHAMRESGYVVHQHSYESLGRHYVLIFYGKTADGQQSKAAIQPNLQKVAQDVATRLPLAELHHVIVLGIEFVSDAADTYMDIDLWIQPVSPMSQKERQLTKQLQRMRQQQSRQTKASAQKSVSHRSLSTKTPIQHTLEGMQMNIKVPSRDDE